jgi:phosphate uptake regulator
MSSVQFFDYEGLNENFKFLVLKIRQQLDDTLTAMQSGEKLVPERMRVREDYIDNLKIIIERKSYKKILRSRTEENRIIRIMGSLNTATSNLEEIGDYLISIVTQLRYFQNHALLGRFDYQAYFREIFKAVDLIVESLFHGKISDALSICQAEIEVDRLFKKDFDDIMVILGEENNIGDAITALNIFRYLERIGDGLLNIGEAVISAYTGTRLKLFEYMALKDNLYGENGNYIIQDLSVETKSGCRIEKVTSKNPGDALQEVIFKEGDFAKIKQEKEKLEKWETVIPGLTPKIFGFQNLHEKALILLEYVGGYNFQEIVLKKDLELQRKAFARLLDTITLVWTKTRKEESVRTDFIGQLRRKLPDVYDVHPALSLPTQFIGNMKHPSLEERLELAGILEKELSAPFSIFIHGDFNADNVIYNEEENRIVYIDPHRSGYSDYVQDVSVFLVSNYRIPVLDAEIRERLVDIIFSFYNFSSEFAHQYGDLTFDARLALGVSRSFITSTRFVLKETFAKEMYLRGIYLLDKLLDHNGKPWTSFRMPEDVFF